MEPFADRPALVPARDLKAQLASLDGDEFDLGRRDHADRRRRDMADVDMGISELRRELSEAEL